MTQLAKPDPCFGCLHFTGIYAVSDTDHRPICKAFPDGIPDEIAYGDNNHTDPYPGDNGIQYEAKE